MDIAEANKKAGEMSNRLQAVVSSVNPDGIQMDLKALQDEMGSEDFWANQKHAQQVSRKAGELEKELVLIEKLQSDIQSLPGMIEMAEQDASLETEVQEMLQNAEKALNAFETRIYFSGEYDASDAIVSFHAGAGGTDAQDWAERLMRMILRFAEQQEWETEVLDQSSGDEAGIKSATIAVRGRFAYGHLRSESGVHRLVRISPFDAEGMRHTSFALIEVLPELDEVNFEIKQDDLRIDTFASGGAGGQSVNTTNSAVRITHIPTNTVVSCQNERSQQQNKETAMKVLRARLHKRLLEERAETLDDIKGGHKPVEWGSQIRSYVMHPYKMVKDHRTNEETQDIDAVLDGAIGPFIDAYLKQEATE